jgi:hypothetical protein
MLFNKGGGQFKQTNTGENPALRQAANANFFGGENKAPIPTSVTSPITMSSNSKGNLE